MPTGYTVKVASGEVDTLKDYALICARAFGALAFMRDDDMDTPVPRYIDPNLRRHHDIIEHLRLTLRRLKDMSDEEADREAKRQHEDSVAKAQAIGAKRELELLRYRAMLIEVEKWEPPETLEELKEFMVSQLQTSIGSVSCPPPETPQPLSGSEWRYNEIMQCMADLKRKKEYLERMKVGTDATNKWLAALWGSLPEERHSGKKWDGHYGTLSKGLG